MKHVAYQRLAAAELVESACFYDQRQAGLGEQFLSGMDAILGMFRAHPGAAG